MRVNVKMWGNSAAVRIPASVMAAARLRVDQAVEVREDQGRVIIEPVVDVAPDLDAMIASITDDNLHPLIDFGPPQGKEAL